MLSDALKEYGDGLSPGVLDILAAGCLSPHHAGQFKAFYKQTQSKYRLHAILEGETGWPREPQDRDVLYFLAQSFRATFCARSCLLQRGFKRTQSALVLRARL